MQVSIDKNFNFVVVGGGTAGWITALYVKKYYPESHVTVVASEEIGILGAGEGVTPHFISFLNEIDLTISDLVANSSATLKNGIKFTNWHGDGTHYYHPFSDNDGLDHTLFSDLNYSNYPLLDLKMFAEGKSLDEIDFSSICSERNLVRMKANNAIWNKDQDPIYHFDSLGSYALHFNAVELANLLEQVGLYRGIKTVKSKVTEFLFDFNNDIKSLILENNFKINSDFVFDCTGFSRLIIGKHYQSTWKSYKEFLPVNKAIPFFLPIEKDIPPYTEAIAMKYGWMWKIPTTKRFGCGYVFDSNQLSTDDAKLEIEQFLGRTVDVPKTFSFEAGCYEKQWINNCISIGLSSGFIEPLEATSIWVSIQALHCFLENIQGLTEKNVKSIDAFNQRMQLVNEKVLEFVSFHYLTEREDTDFWKNFKNNNKILDSLSEILNSFETDLPDKTVFRKNDIFTFKSWYAVGGGLRKFDKDRSFKTLNSFTQGIRGKYFENFEASYLKNLKINTISCIDHTEFLNYMIENYRR